jgi:hypothetical protein
MRITKRELARRKIKENVIIDPVTGCWNWQLSLNKGYGVTCYLGHQVTVHRLSYRLFVAQIPASKMICHKCDNKRCCNPHHLFIGTNSDNQKDYAHKHGATRSDRNGK